MIIHIIALKHSLPS